MVREWSVSELMEAVAARTASPGGGAAAACAAALGAGLVEMAARFAPDQLERVGARAAELRARALDVAELELRAYEPVLEALALPDDDPGRAEQLRDARSRAADPPVALARVAAEVAELASQAASCGNPNLRGDAITAVLLAEAACGAAATLVRINLGEGRPDDRRYDVYDLGRRALSAREEALRTG
jgi:formiminotetrahydrofolate cyclodeaminase